MANYKGTGIVVLEKLLNDTSPEAFNNFLELLTVDEREQFSQTLPLSWIDAELAASFSERAAKILFPNLNESQRLAQLGKARAYEHLRGIYRVILKVISIQKIIEHSAKLWRTYHDQGEAWLHKIKGKNEAIYMVANYTDLPVAFLEIIRGYTIGIMELGRAKNIVTTIIDDDPNLWRWKATWEE